MCNLLPVAQHIWRGRGRIGAQARQIIEMTELSFWSADCYIARIWNMGPLPQNPPPAFTRSFVGPFQNPWEIYMPAVSHARAQAGFLVLVVSPDEQVYLSLRQILRHECRMRRAAGRRDAVALLRKFRPCVVVCDQVLSDGNWKNLLQDLQSEPQMPPLIVSSRLADDRLWAEVLNLGGYDLLMSPFSTSEVSRVVKMAAHRGGQEWRAVTNVHR